MKIKKQKLLALLTVITLIIGFMPTNILAGTGTYISVADKEVSVGEEVTVEIKAAKDLQADDIGIQVIFDNTALSLTKEATDDPNANITFAAFTGAFSDGGIQKDGKTIEGGFAASSAFTVEKGTTLLSIKFYALKSGVTNISAWISVTDDDNDFDDEETVTSKVTIKEPTVADTSITLDKAELRLEEGESGKLVATVEPSNATDKTVTWTSSDSSVATVDKEGNVTAVKEGNTTITAKTASGKEATCSVIVTKSACTHTNLRTVEAKNPSCTVDGNNEYKVCTDCGKVFKADGVTETTVEAETKKALGHDFSKDNHDETQHWKECSRCGIADTKVNHVGEGEYVKDSQNHWKVCGCGTIVEKEAHTAGEVEVENVIKPTCTEAGSHDEVIHCTVCGYEISRTQKEDKANGHTPADPVNENIVPPTCTETGSHDEVVYCSVCHAEISRTAKVDKENGHTPGEPKEENKVPATCSEEGHYDEVVYCTVCKKELSREQKKIDKIPHDVADVSWSNDETQHWKECGCGTKVDLANHEAADSVNENIVAPTCTEAGSHDEVVYCSVCGYEMSRTAKVDKATGHTPSDSVNENVVPPTCTEAGSHDEVVYCSVCHKEISRAQKVDKAKGHTPSDPVNENVVPPTCTEAGSHDEVVYCSVCKAEISRTAKVDKATGHTEGEAVIENEIEATVDSEGSYDEVVYCIDCNKELSRTKKTTPKFVYEITDGEGSEHTKNTDDSITIESNGKPEKLIEIKVNGETLDKDDYTVENKNGKTLITLKPEYLNKLSKDEYSIALVYNDGEISTTFNVVEKTATPANNNSNRPQTGDSSNMTAWIIGLAVSGILFVLVLGCKVKGKQKRSRH